jgi:hypothetical protein
MFATMANILFLILEITKGHDFFKSLADLPGRDATFSYYHSEPKAKNPVSLTVFRGFFAHAQNDKSFH